MSSQRTPAPLAYLITGYRRAMFAAGVAAMSMMMAVIVAQVFCRYLLGFSLIWSEEFCRVLLVWITFLFGGLALERGEVIALDLVAGITNRPLRLSALLAGGVASLIVLGWMVVLGYNYAVFNLGQKLAALQVSQFWVYISIPIGLSLLGIHFALHVWQQILSAAKSTPPTEKLQ